MTEKEIKLGIGVTFSICLVASWMVSPELAGIIVVAVSGWVFVWLVGELGRKESLCTPAEDLSQPCRDYRALICAMEDAMESAERARLRYEAEKTKIESKIHRLDSFSYETLLTLEDAAKKWRLWVEGEMESRELSNDERYLFDAAGWFVEEDR